MAKPERLEGRIGLIWQLYIKGNTQQAIADQLGISQSKVSESIAVARKEIPQRTRDEVVQERLELLSWLTSQMVPLAEGGDAEASRTILKIMEREARLLGLDNPVKAQVDATVRYEVVGIDPEDL